MDHFRVYLTNQMWLSVVCTLIDNETVRIITLFPNIFFLLFLHVERAKVFERKV